MDVRLHRFAPADGVTREQQETAKTLDLVKVEIILGAANLDPVFLRQLGHQIAAIAFAVALDAADLVKERRQDALIGVAHAGKGKRLVPLYVALDQRLAVVLRPLVQTFFRIVNVTLEKRSMI